jgi:hypothetical protein
MSVREFYPIARLAARTAMTEYSGFRHGLCIYQESE